jgi:hypothetical protein
MENAGKGDESMSWIKIYIGRTILVKFQKDENTLKKAEF